MTDRLFNAAHWAACFTFGALATFAWLMLASLMLTGFLIVYMAAFARTYAMPAVVVASVGGSVALLLLASSQVTP